ncbi:MAG: SMC-Scp complex subunit ScpB [Chloroflexota bacterium]
MPSVTDRDQLKRVIDSILFVADGPVEVRTLARLCEATTDDITAALDELGEESQTRGIRIQRTGQSAQMASASETAPFVQSYLGIDEHQRLTPTVLVTLTVIAYKQPVTKGEVERILRKNCEYSVMMLKARELITEVGRAEGPGRPYLYGTTFKFLEHFGLEKPEDLPPLPELEVAAAATAEEAEAQEASAEPADSPDAQLTNGASPESNGAHHETNGASPEVEPDLAEAPAE